MAKKKTGRWVKKSEMIQQTGLSTHTIDVYSSGKNARIEKKIDENNKRWYWLDDGKKAFSAAGAKKLKGEKKEPDMSEGKLLSIPKYADATGLPVRQLYRLTDEDLLPTEKDDKDRKCLRFMNKNHALTQFANARKTKEKVVVEAAKQAENEAIKEEYHEGETISPTLWCANTEMNYSAMMTAIKANVFDECRLKLEQGGEGKRMFLEWPGKELADKISEILTKYGRSWSSKKFMLNLLLNDDEPESTPEPVVETPPEPEPTPEPTLESESTPCEVTKLEFNQLKTKLYNLEQKFEAMSRFVKQQASQQMEF